MIAETRRSPSTATGTADEPASTSIRLRTPKALLGLANRFLWVPAAVLPGLLALALALDPRGSFDPPWLLLPLNVVFLMVLPAFVAWMAVSAYRTTGVMAVLAAGAAMLATGLGSGVLANVLLYTNDINAAMTIHDGGALVAGLCVVAGAVATVEAASARSPRGRHIVAAYGLVVFAVALILLLILGGWAPVFFVQGEGPTAIGQLVLGASIVCFASAALSWWQLRQRNPGIAFFGWCFLSLALYAVGLAGVFAGREAGGLVSWTGRLAQYLAGLYFLGTALAARRGIGSSATPQRALGVAVLQAALPYHSLVESTTDAVMALRRDGTILYWNDTASRLFGYDSTEVFGRDVVDCIFPAADRAMSGSVVRDCLTPGAGSPGGRTTALVMAHRDGRRFQGELAVYGEPSLDPVVCVARDITERRAAEERYRTVVDSLVDGVVVQDAAGQIVASNPAARAILGLGVEDLTGRTSLDPPLLGVHPDGTPWSREEHPVTIARTTGRTVTGAVMDISHPDGVRKSILINARPLLATSGSVEGAVMSFADITERKRAEDEIRTQNVELEARVQARTAALEAANRELEAFSYSVSHDLRAPLRSINAFSKILLSDHAAQLDPEAQRILGVVARNARQMGTLIDDLLAFSRVGRKEIERRTVDMGVLARLAAEEAQAAAPDRDVTIDIGSLCTVMGDSGLLRQVWVNLLGNAVKFTRPAREARIEICCEHVSGECRYTVSDNGVGFDPAYTNKLFQPFQRLHPTTEFEGTGIGLAMVARIVQRHGGHVWADGAPGAGATFGFALPAEDKP